MSNLQNLYTQCRHLWGYVGWNIINSIRVMKKQKKARCWGALWWTYHRVWCVLGWCLVRSKSLFQLASLSVLLVPLSSSIGDKKISANQKMLLEFRFYNLLETSSFPWLDTSDFVTFFCYDLCLYLVLLFLSGWRQIVEIAKLEIFLFF